MAVPESRFIKFRLGRSTAKASVRVVDPDDHPYVFAATLVRGIWHKFIHGILLRLPFQDLVRRLWPVYFLPDRIILKLYKPEWEQYYRNEKDMYEKLKALQGRVVPTYYGEALCGDVPALVLSEVRGVLACEQKNPRLGLEEFRRRIGVVVEELGRFGVIQSDRKLHNVFLVEDRVVFIDLEMAFDVVDDPERLAFAMEYSVNDFGNQYVDYLSDVSS